MIAPPTAGYRSPMTPLRDNATSTLDLILDRSIVLGYTTIGYRIRKHQWAPEHGQPLRGKNVLVTGATSGIGMAAARGLAERGATVHVLGRNSAKLDKAVSTLCAAVPGADFVAELCDVSSMADVRRFCADFSTRVPELHGLAHNAGTMAETRTETSEGHEVNFATHALGPFLMTQLLTDSMAADGSARVVFMSSGGMYTHPFRDDDPEYLEDGYSAAKAYARTKRFQVVLAELFAERLASLGITVNSMHPGWVDTPGVQKFLPTFSVITRPIIRDDAQGADTLVWLLASPEPAGTTGKFGHDRAQRPTSYGRKRPQTAPQMERLWDYCAQESRPTPAS